MTRAVIYCRCSTEEECQKDALIRQAAEARECVRRLNWSLEDEYIESRSGTSTRGREQYQRLFSDLLRDKFEIVVIKSQDRLMRNTKDWYVFVDRLVTCGKRLYLYLENRFYSADDSLITGIKAILAEEYSRELSRKINNAHRNRQKTGSALMLTSNTYGYRKLPDKSLAIIEEEAQVKRKMYELCAGGLGSRCIARILREDGVQKRNGSFFTDSDIRRMIRNPVNKGTVVMNRKHYDFDTRQVVKNPQEQFYIYENRIPAIVSEELWKAANEEIDKRKKPVGNQERTARCFGVNPGKHVFSGKLVCGLCGAPFYRTTRKRKNYKIHEWKCKIYLEQGRKKEEKPGGCANIHLEEEKLFLLLERFGGKEILPDQEWEITDFFMQLLKESLEENQKKDLEKYEQLKKKIKYQQQLLLDKYLEGLVEESLYQIKERELQNKLKNNTGSRTCRQKNRDFLAEEQEEVEKRLRETEQFLKEHRVVLKACVLCELKMVDKILIYPDHLKVVKKQGKCIIAAETFDMLY